MTIASYAYLGRYSAFHHPSHVRNALCDDGKRRTVRLNIDADTAFSWPGRASVNGKTVRGFVTSFEAENGERDMKFITYKGKA